MTPWTVACQAPLCKTSTEKKRASWAFRQRKIYYRKKERKWLALEKNQCSLSPLGTTLTLCPWDSPGKNTGMGCHALLQGIFPTQGSNLCFLCCRQILYCLSYQGSPKKIMQQPKSRGNDVYMYVPNDTRMLIEPILYIPTLICH